MRAFALLAVFLFPLAAHADLGELSVAVAPAYAIAYVDSRAPSGVGVSLDVGVGVSEALSVHLSGFTSWHPVGATQQTAAGTIGAFAAMAGLTYTLDVIRLVPSFDVVLGVIGLRGDASFADSAAASAVVAPSTAFGVGLGFGLDYLLTRHVAVGLVVRYHALLTDLGRIPVYLYAGPRVTFRFGG